MISTLPEPLLDVPKLVEWLGIKENTIRKWVCYGRIPYLKCGRRVLFRRQDIERWLLKTNPQSEKWDELLPEPQPRSV